MSTQPTVPNPAVVTGNEPVAAALPACCGGAPQVDAAACCVLDETLKAAGEAGCGCDAGAVQAPPPDAGVQPAKAAAPAPARAACCASPGSNAAAPSHR